MNVWKFFKRKPEQVFIVVYEDEIVSGLFAVLDKNPFGEELRQFRNEADARDYIRENNLCRARILPVTEFPALTEPVPSSSLRCNQVAAHGATLPSAC